MIFISSSGGGLLTASDISALSRKDVFCLHQPAFLRYSNGRAVTESSSALFPSRLNTTSSSPSPVSSSSSVPPPPPPQSNGRPKMKPPPTRFPFLVLAPTFIFTHFTLAWALVPPIYLFLRSTNLSNSILTGPQGAWFLSRKVPDFVPNEVVNGLVGPPSDAQLKGDRGQDRPTVEELLERLARRAVRAVWRMGRGAYGTFKSGASEEDALAKAAVGEIRGSNSLPENEPLSKSGNFKDKMLGATSRKARGVADDISFGQIRDGVAAWVVVKLLFPVRLPISLLLTPRVARGLRAFFARR